MDEFSVTFKKDVLGKYLPRMILEKRQSRAVIRRHAIFANKALLKAWMSRKPSPPRLLGCVSFSQESQQIFLSSAFESHQKRVSTDWIFLQIPTGRRKQDIAKLGIAEITDCSMIAFPAVDRNCTDQPIDRWYIMSTMEAKRSFLFRPKCSGRPRYFPTPPSFSIPSWCLTLVRTSAGVLLEIEIEDF